ncbi:MAG: DNA cytosine methyltransferase [Acidobacteriota bacterium]
MALQTISLFTGAGGLDLGLEAAGFEQAIAVEMDQDCVTTIECNPERDWRVIPRSILDVESSEILQQAGLAVGDADLLVGGPPCQPFSKSGFWATGDAGRLDDPRSATLGEFLRVLRDTQPKAFLLENVPGLKFSQKDEGLQLIRSELDAINEALGTDYQLCAKQLNSVEYGVPQVRERVFVVGQRDGKAFEFPQPTHSRPPRVDPAKASLKLPLKLQPELEAPRVAWDALGDLEDEDRPELKPRGKFATLLPSIPEGKNYLFHTPQGDGLGIFGWRRRYWSMLLKLAKNLPSWTLTAQPGPAIGPFHWKNRRLSARELCRLQTIPDGYTISGDPRAVQRQLGNAVPSAMAEILGREIRRQLLDGHAPTAKPSLIPERRRPIPAPETPGPVPEAFYAMVADHEPHPGTGKGPGALARAKRS